MRRCAARQTHPTWSRKRCSKPTSTSSQFQGQTEAELVAWLRRILTRNLADLVRRFKAAGARSVAREQSLDDVIGASSRALFELVAPNGHSPSQSAQRRELSIILADALAELAADHREVVVLRTLEGRDWDEVARAMGRSPGAVRLLVGSGTQEACVP